MAAWDILCARKRVASRLGEGLASRLTDLALSFYFWVFLLQRSISQKRCISGCYSFFLDVTGGLGLGAIGSIPELCDWLKLYVISTKYCMSPK